MTQILGTGANGFIARHLLQRHLLPWVDQGQCRLTLTDLSMPTRPLSGGLVDSQRAARVHCVQGDLANPQNWASLMAEPVDTIFHLAAMVSGAAEQHFEAGLRADLGDLIQQWRKALRIRTSMSDAQAEQLAARRNAMKDIVIGQW